MNILDLFLNSSLARNIQNDGNGGRPMPPAPNAPGDRSPEQPRRYSGIITIRRVDGVAFTPPRDRAVPKRDVGKGIRINGVKEPNICPQCRTPNMITKVRNMHPEWRCGVCGHEF